MTIHRYHVQVTDHLKGGGDKYQVRTTCVAVIQIPNYKASKKHLVE